jgi:hypothetical protein
MRGRGGTCGGTPYRWFGRRINSTKIMREEDGAMAVGCRHSMKGHNNQPNVGVLNGDDIGDGARPRWNVFGGRFNFVWGDKLSSKNKQK